MASVVSPGVNLTGTLYIRFPSESMFATVSVVSEDSSLRESGQCRRPLRREFQEVFLTLDAAVSTDCWNYYISQLSSAEGSLLSPSNVWVTSNYPTDRWKFWSETGPWYVPYWKIPSLSLATVFGSSAKTLARIYQIYVKWEVHVCQKCIHNLATVTDDPMIR